jgi:hypothetical protein
MSAIKVVDPHGGRIRMLLFPNGGPFGGRDGAGEYFNLSSGGTKTDLCLSWFKAQRPLLYHHGLDADAGTSPVGYIDPEVQVDEQGGWVQAQLDLASDFYRGIVQLIQSGKLACSSGAMAHLVERTKGGLITRWPWIEGSLTPTPSNPFAVVGFAEASKHYKSAGLALPDFLRAAPAEGYNVDKNEFGIGREGFAYVDSKGHGHLPVHDAAHARAALSRFSSTQFESESAKRRAWRKIMAAARRFGIDASDTTMPGKSMGYLHRQGDQAIAAVRDYVNGVWDLQTRRLKEGRMLSSGNLQAVSDALAQIQDLQDDLADVESALQALVDRATPAADAGKAIQLKAQLQVLKLKAAL